jgi:hypothetical protein
MSRSKSIKTIAINICKKVIGFLTFASYEDALKVTTATAAGQNFTCEGIVMTCQLTHQHTPSSTKKSRNLLMHGLAMQGLVPTVAGNLNVFPNAFDAGAHNISVLRGGIYASHGPYTSHASMLSHAASSLPSPRLPIWYIDSFDWDAFFPFL